MGRRKKTSIEGVISEGNILYIKKNHEYKAVEENTTYIPRSNFYAHGCGYKIAIFDKLITDGAHWEKHQIVMNGEEFKKAVGIKEEGRISIR